MTEVSQAVESTLAARVRALEDREAIRDLVARYNCVMDNRDLPGMQDLFTDDVRVGSHDGVMDSRGKDDVVAMFQGRWAILGPSYHWSHDHRIHPDPEDPDRATGHVQLHAEMTRRGKAAISSLRYEDVYRRCSDEHWRFSQRLLSFFYYMDPHEYADVLEHPLRVRSEAEPVAAGWPEATDTWKAYYAEHPRP